MNEFRMSFYEFYVSLTIRFEEASMGAARCGLIDEGPRQKISVSSTGTCSHGVRAVSFRHRKKL